MNVIKNLFHFLGSVHFAISLIGVTALFVLAGTIIESKTGSHLFAAYYTYQHPAFLLLLGLFFINILFAALRRWPFKFHHIPFLITHLGLLMILSGVFIKSSFGIQGTMSILEGSGSHEILIPNTYSIKIFKKNTLGTVLSSEYSLHSRSSPFPELQIETVGYAPHSSEITETWIKGDRGVIAGLKPFKVFSEKNFLDISLPISARVSLLPSPAEPWNLYAFYTADVLKVLQRVYLEGLVIKITDSITNQLLYQGLVQEALITPPQWKEGKVFLQLNLEEEYFHIIAQIEDPKNIQTELKIPLTGPEALDNIPERIQYLGRIPIAIDLERPAALLFVQNEVFNDTSLFAFDPYGRIHKESFPAKGLSSLIAYDNGWGGYYAHSTIPFSATRAKRQQKEDADLATLTYTLEKAPPEKLSPPLRMLYNACQKAHCDFAQCCAEYLSLWDKSYSWLYPIEYPTPPLFAQVSKELDWSEESPTIKKCCAWLSRFFLEIDPLLRQGFSPRKILEQFQWPAPLPQGDENFLLTTLTQQIFSVGDMLPDNQAREVVEARLFSAYLRAYGIHLQNMRSSNEALQTEDSIQLECPLTLRHLPKPPLQKVEECVPVVKLKLTKEDKTEELILSYDRSAMGLYWPAFEGEYLLRFQPRSKKIPYHIRLRNARRIDYPHSTQPFSYESDFLIKNFNPKENSKEEEKTISMNNVHETWDGFRFYLAGLSTNEETAAKRVQLVVNHDPAKYWLTYPGGAILSLGIALLFFCRKPRSH